jgi:intracellular sulfur oxidation DsrE/DsrF family protein
MVAFGETRVETYPFPETVAVAIVAVAAMRLVTVVEATRVVVTKLLANKVPVTVCVTTVMPGKFPFPKASSVDAVHTITPPIAAS